MPTKRRIPEKMYRLPPAVASANAQPRDSDPTFEAKMKTPNMMTPPGVQTRMTTQSSALFSLA